MRLRKSQSFRRARHCSYLVRPAVWGSLLDTTAEIWDDQMRLNLRYFFLVAREVAQSLIRREQQGAIVGIASVDGQRAAPMRVGRLMRREARRGSGGLRMRH